jgi:hypothetical protein
MKPPTTSFWSKMASWGLAMTVATSSLEALSFKGMSQLSKANLYDPTIWKQEILYGPEISLGKRVVVADDRNAINSKHQTILDTIISRSCASCVV